MASRLRKKKQDGSSAPRVEAFSDIAFLLIIFFILTTTFDQTQGFLANIPSAEKGEAQQEETPEINIKGETIFWGKQRVNEDELEQKVRALELSKRKPGERAIILEGGDSVPYEIYYRVMALVQEHGGIVVMMEDE